MAEPKYKAFRRRQSGSMSRSAKRRVQRPVSHRVRPVDFSDLPLLFPGHARLQHNTVWHHSQAVRQRSAKSPFSSSILDGASKAKLHATHGVLFWTYLACRIERFDLWMVPPNTGTHAQARVFVFGHSWHTGSKSRSPNAVSKKSPKQNQCKAFNLELLIKKQYNHLTVSSDSQTRGV